MRSIIAFKVYKYKYKTNVFFWGALNLCSTDRVEKHQIYFCLKRERLLLCRKSFYFPLNIKKRILRRIVFNYCGRCSMCNRLHWSLREKSESTTFSSSQMNENEMFDFISFELLFKILSRATQLLMQTADFKLYETAWT